MPFKQLQDWLDEEKLAGASNPNQAVLSTVANQVPHARVVAIREISDKGLLFFTQKCTRKVSELKMNPKASLTYWFELKQRQINIEGEVSPLTDEENKAYWQSYPKEFQVRFCAYAPTSSMPIESKQVLEDKRDSIRELFQDKDIPMSTDYCGFRLRPEKFVFYAYQPVALSDVCSVTLEAGAWKRQTLSP